MTDNIAKKDAPRRSRLQRVRRAGLWSLVLVLLLAAGVGGGAVWMKGRTILAPDWLRARIENRLTEVLPDLQIDFGAMELVVDEGWRPRARVRNVVVTGADGIEIVALSEVKASMAMRPLLKGQLETKNIDLTGVFATLRRDVDGAMALSGGNGVAAPAQKAGSLTQLIDQLDGVLQKPGVSSLTRLSIRALTLRYEDARSGRAWTIDGGRLQVLRTGDDLKMSADLSVLSGGAGVATLDANYETRIGSSQSDFGINIGGVQAGDIAVQGAAFAWLAPLRATISGSLHGGVTASGGLLPLNATLQIGKGTIQPTNETAPIPFESARSYFTYIPATGELRFDELSVRSDWVSGRAEGLVALQGVADGNLRDLVGQFQLSNLRINPYDLYPEPAAIAVAEMDFQLKLDPFELTLGRLQLSDQGQTILANAKVSAAAEGWSVAADARMNAITPDRLTALWPESLVPKTRNWIATNFLSGNLRNIDVVFRQTSGAKPDTYLGFEYDAAEVRFLKTMPHLRDATGQASLFGRRLVVTVEKGDVPAPQGGLVDVSGTSFIIPDVTVKGGAPAVTRLTTRSTVTAALSLLNQPPMTVMDKAKLPVTLADGQAELRGTLSFPLRKGSSPDSVRYDVEGTLINLKSDTLIKGRVLAASQLTVTASNDAVRIGGKGRLDAVDFDAEWIQQIGPEHAGKSTVRGTLELSERTLDTFKIALPPGSVSGRGDGTFNLDLIRGAPPKFTITSDLRGIRVAAPPVGWVKPAQNSGQLLVSGTLGPVPVVSELQISGPGLSATGAVSLKGDGTLDRVRIDRLKVGQWLDVPVDLVGRGAGKTPAVVVKGGSLDLRAGVLWQL